jgi:hypothetical protein
MPHEVPSAAQLAEEENLIREVYKALEASRTPQAHMGLPLRFTT